MESAAVFGEGGRGELVLFRLGAVYGFVVAGGGGEGGGGGGDRVVAEVVRAVCGGGFEGGGGGV